MTVEPRVELLFHPTDLDPRDLKRAGDFLGSPAQALEAGLGSLRLMMIDRMKTELAATTGEIGVDTLVHIADLAWQAVFWRFRKISAPVLADAYVRAYRRADAGDVPIQLIYDLADRHTDRIGDYFHSSSSQAMVEGFNTYVNRRVGAKAAADRVMDAYGLTPRQMRGYTAATQSLEGKVTSPESRSLKGRVREYITRSFRKRIQKFVEQEEHNVDQQAQQFAWMWLVDKGRLSPLSEKIWVTAKDERVCEVCGPLHGQKVGINERFQSSQGAFWTPGVHPNCRCWVRLIENTFTIEKAYVRGQWEEEEHPRGQGGQFRTKTKPRVTTATRTAPADAEWLQRMRTLARADVLEAEKTPLTTTTPLGADTALGDVGLGADTALGAEAPATQALGAPAQTAGLSTQALGIEALAPAALDVAAITVDSLQEANPALTVEHLAASSLAYEQAMAPTSAPPAPVTRLANIYDIPGDPRTGENLVYYYDKALEVKAPGNKAVFTTEQGWLKGSEGRAAIFASAVEDVNTEIGKMVREIVSGEDERRISTWLHPGVGMGVTLQNPVTGEAFAITGEDLRRMITDTAFKYPSEPMETFVWDADDPTESQGETRDLPTEEVMELLGITAKDFEKTIYVTARGHDQEALPLETETKRGQEVWLNTGEFEVTHESTEAENQGPFRVVNLEPVVEIEEHQAD